MNVVGFSGYSGAGKTTLIEQVVARMAALGLRVSVVKHAHHDFDIDRPGKDSWRHRQAGAHEVLVGSDRRTAKIHELRGEPPPEWRALISKLAPCEWVLLEGFKRAEWPKIEVWRPETGQPLIHPEDANVVAIATTTDAALAGIERLTRLDIDDPAAVVSYLLAAASRFAFDPAAEARPPSSDAGNAPSRLLPLDDALAIIVAAAVPFSADAAQTVGPADALGRILAVDVVSSVDVPPADNSAMDGYALRVADVPAPSTELPVALRVPAGSAPSTLPPGAAARIFTGAPIPQGADAVVMQERCEAQGDRVRVLEVPSLGNAIRRHGEDVAVGTTVLRRGMRLTPQALGLAAAVGLARFTVAPKPRVALFSTGDELVEPGSPLPPGAIYNSNRTTLRALIAALGADCTDYGIVPDRLDATRAALRSAAASHDVIVTSGGVSVGEEDHLKPAVRAEGDLHLWQVAIKPGKPLAFGSVRRPDGAGTAPSSAHFVGLPGNPVASVITFLIAVRPLLLRLQGVDDWRPRPVAARADFDWPRPDKRREFLRVRRNDSGGLSLYPHQGSGVLTSTVWADGVVDLAPGRVVRSGDPVPYLAFSELLG